MSLLTWLESTSLAVWVHESPSIWAQPTVMTFHTMGMGILAGACWVLDLRLLGVGKTVPLAAFRWVFRAVGISLVVNILTGLLLFIARATLWGTAFPFLLKILLVIASVSTLVPIRSYIEQCDDAQVDVSSRMRLLAVLSIAAWAAAITSGRLLAYTVAG